MTAPPRPLRVVVTVDTRLAVAETIRAAIVVRYHRAILDGHRWQALRLRVRLWRIDRRLATIRQEVAS